jgi:hypothetical protein
VAIAHHCYNQPKRASSQRNAIASAWVKDVIAPLLGLNLGVNSRLLSGRRGDRYHYLWSVLLCGGAVLLGFAIERISQFPDKLIGSNA